MEKPTIPSLLLLLAPALAQAAEAPLPAERCTGIASDVQRLACYDAALGRGAALTQEADAAADQVVAEAVTADEQAGVIDRLSARARLATPSRTVEDDRDRDALVNVGRGSLLDRRWELARDSKLGVFNLRSYKPIYLLPVFWTSDTNATPTSPNPDNVVDPADAEGVQPFEAKFQISFKAKVVENLIGDNGDLWVGYTQNSRWQVFNNDRSRPFRETNYEPEAMLVFRNNYRIGAWRGRMTGIGLNHQSNGRGLPLSRSWNRMIMAVGLDREHWALTVRPWWRLSESEGADDNRDISDYVGRGDATLVYSPGTGHEFTLTARHSLRGGDRSHGAVQGDWSFPISRLLRGHVQAFSGYGESLIDYNHKATYIGLGVSLSE